MQLSRTQQISLVYLADYIVTEGTGGDTRKLGQPTLLTKVSDVDTFVRPWCVCFLNVSISLIENQVAPGT